MKSIYRIKNKITIFTALLSFLLLAFDYKPVRIRRILSIKDFPELAHSIPEKIEKINETVAKLEPTISKPPLCDTCEKIVPKNCTDQNSYFEEELIDFQNTGSHFMNELITPIDEAQVEQGIDLRCVRASLEAFPPIRFRRCVPAKDNPHSLVAIKADKPCVTDRLASTLTKSFNIAAKCLEPVIGQGGDYQYKLQKIFELISIESGFHTNVVGSNNDVGIGQLQSGAVAGINRLIIDETQNSLRHSNVPECRKLYREFLMDDHPIESKNICNRIAPAKGNPWKNMIYTFLYFKVNRDILDDIIFNHSPYKERLNMPHSELEKLKDELAKWAHNKGAGGASKVLARHLMNHFNPGSFARSADQILIPITNSKKNYLRKSAARAAHIANMANLSQEESCIRGY